MLIALIAISICIAYIIYRHFSTRVETPGLFIDGKKQSLLEIAKNLRENHINIDSPYWLPLSEIHGLMLKGFWEGCFDKVTSLDRLHKLKMMMGIKSIRDAYIWNYLDESPHTVSREFPDGSIEYDMRPMLTVPSKNTDTWTSENCKNAFLELARQDIGDGYYNLLWFNILSHVIISQKVMHKFLFKQSVLGKVLLSFKKRAKPKYGNSK